MPKTFQKSRLDGDDVKNRREEGLGRKRIGMIDDRLEKELFGDQKRGVEDRQKIGKNGEFGCRMVEH